ncbi:MAG: hypothetical protein FJ118_06010 [Deltaproteobacteria bacterium]|nr:hypothetical protein [Deltaproteobacteria bacterium]
MVRSGEKESETIRPQFDRAIVMDFQRAKITSDTAFLLLRSIDERFGILSPIESELEDTRSWVHSSHTQLQMVRQRVYQIAAGYEDCNDADFLRAAKLRTGSKRERTRRAGTRRVAVAFQPTRPACSWECWPATCSTCSGSSTSWAKRSNGRWNGSSSV